VWSHVCPALRAALAAPQPACARALVLLRRLVAAAHEAGAGPQLAQLATVLAVHLGAHAAADAALCAAVAAALVEADAALRDCWQVCA
jgi:hypothetical protein